MPARVEKGPAWVQRAQPPLSLLQLPADVLLRIAAFVDKAYLHCYRATCRAFRAHHKRPARSRRAAMLITPTLAEWAWDQRGFRPQLFTVREQRRMCARAAKEGSIATLAWLHERRCAWNGATCAAAAGSGHLDVLQWARRHKCPWDGGTCSEAALGGHLAVLEWARASGCPWGTGTCTHAAQGGHLAVLEWLRASGCPWDAHKCLLAASSLEVREFIRGELGLAIVQDLPGWGGWGAVAELVPF